MTFLTTGRWAKQHPYKIPNSECSCGEDETFLPREQTKTRCFSSVLNCNCRDHLLVEIKRWCCMALSMTSDIRRGFCVLLVTKLLLMKSQAYFVQFSANFRVMLAKITIRTEMITNENLEILFRFRFRNGKANKFPQIFFCIRFRNGHVGHAQATAAGHTYESKIKSQRFSFAFAFVIQQRENPKSWDLYFFRL